MNASKSEARTFLWRLQNSSMELQDIEISDEIYMFHRNFLSNLPIKFQNTLQTFVDEAINNQYRAIWLGHILRSINAGRTVGMYVPAPGDDKRIQPLLQQFIDS